jgi:hypothetical protein
MKTDIKDQKIMFKWLISLSTWTVMCFILVFWVKWNIIISMWMIVIGAVAHVKRSDYRKWYNRVYGTNY